MLTIAVRSLPAILQCGIRFALTFAMARPVLPALVFLLMLSAAPAAASGGTAVPEPSDLALFTLGLAGLIIGRQSVKRRRRDEDDRDA